MAASLALVVLAAGLGSRYGGMKQLAEVGPGRQCLMDYAIYDAVHAGFESVILVVSEGGREAIKAHADAGFARLVQVYYATQPSSGRRKPWGTGHALLSAQAFVEGPFGVVNADDYYGRRSVQLLAEALSGTALNHILIGYPLRDTLSEFGGVSRGVCQLDGKRLRSVVELHDVRRQGGVFRCRNSDGRELTGDEVVSTNLWGFQPAFFDTLAEGFSDFRAGADSDAEFLIGSGVTRLIERGGSVTVLKTSDRFFGVTFGEDLLSVKQRISSLTIDCTYPERLWQ